MKKYLFSYVVDGVFFLAVTFFAASTAFVFYTRGRAGGYVAAAFLTAAVGAIYVFTAKRKIASLRLRQKNEKNYLCARQTLLLSDEKTILTVFTDYLSKKGKTIQKENGFLVSGENFVCWKLSYDGLTVGDVVSFYKLTPKGKRLVLIGDEFTEKATDFAKGFSGRIRLLPLVSLFPELREYGCLPETDFPALPERKKNLRAVLRHSFDKKKGKKYALYGIFLLLFSYFVFYPLWYVVSGCAMIVYAIAVTLFAPAPLPDDIF